MAKVNLLKDAARAALLSAADAGQKAAATAVAAADPTDTKTDAAAATNAAAAAKAAADAAGVAVAAAKTQAESDALERWQQGLQWFMVGSVGIAFLFLFIAAYAITPILSKAGEPITQTAIFSQTLPLPADGKSYTDSEQRHIQWITRTSLEQALIASRYNQVRLALVTRTWVLGLGFVTGMLLALMGAAFILGKLSDSGTKIELTNTASTGTNVLASNPLAGSFQSASPGIILAVLGTVLMGITLGTDHKINIDDTNTYLSSEGVAAKANMPSLSSSDVDQIGNALQERLNADKKPPKSGSAKKP